MSNKKTIKKDNTLIEEIVENSKEIINLKNVILLLSEAIYASAKCKYRQIDDGCLKGVLKEYRVRIQELQIHNANVLKAAYTHQYVIIADDFFISTAEMQAGFITLYRKNHDKTSTQVALFLSDVEPDNFLEPIKAGEIREYSEELEKNYLSHCKPVWNPSSLKDLYLERLKLMMK